MCLHKHQILYKFTCETFFVKWLIPNVSVSIFGLDTRNFRHGIEYFGMELPIPKNYTYS